MANHRSLEVSALGGRVMAGYLTFARRPGDTAARTTHPEPGLAVDHADDGRAIGLEITAPGKVTLSDINRVLATLGQAPATADELAPLFVARGGGVVARRRQLFPVRRPRHGGDGPEVPGEDADQVEVFGFIDPHQPFRRCAGEATAVGTP